MEKGIKLHPEGFFELFRGVGIQTANPDENFDRLRRALKRGRTIDYAAYVLEVEGTPQATEREDFHYEGIRFYLDERRSMRIRRIDVQLGPRVQEFVCCELSDRLFYLDRPTQRELATECLEA